MADDRLPQAPLTVLVSTRDRPVLLERCLRAVLAGELPPEDLLVVDQSRSDATRQVVDRLREEGHEAVRWVRHEGAGLSRSQNLGFAEARHDVIAVTDDDCVPRPDWTRAVADAFLADPALGLLGGRVLALGPDEPGRFPVSTRPSTRPLRLDDRSRPWDVGSGNNFAVRRTALVDIGGNDERLGSGARLRSGGDMDLFRRLLRSGAVGCYEPAVVVLHERADRAERLGRRVPYGYGMGACLSLWWRQGDRHAARLLLAWVRLRASRLREGLATRDGLRVWEEVLVLLGTVRGLARGALTSPAAPVTGW